MKTTIILSMIVASLSLLGCSKKQIYEAIQQNRQQECQNLPLDQYEDCLEEYDERYDSYKRARDEALEQQ